MFHIAVCEDDPLQTEIILSLLNKYQDERPGMNMRTYSFDSGDSVLQSVDAGQEFNLFLLDILLPGMNGIELARELRAKTTDVPLVFLTSSADYALDAFKVSATQYILKPVKHDELFPVLDHIIAAQKQEKERFFMLTIQKSSVKISYKAIVCVELAGRTMQFHLDNGETLLSNTIRISFSDALAPLLADSRFLHEHKSFVLNMEHVREVGGNTFTMAGGLKIPIPRYNVAKAKAKYFAWLKEQERH